jgi:hypothetical protein
MGMIVKGVLCDTGSDGDDGGGGGRKVGVGDGEHREDRKVGSRWKMVAQKRGPCQGIR